MKLLLLALAFALPASAETINFDGTITTSCTFSGTTDGTLNIIGTTITTGTSGSTVITNNDPGAYSLTVSPITSITAPDGLTITGNLTQTPNVSTGPNSAETFTGDDATGYTATLTAAGADTFTLSLTGTLDGTATAGTYTAVSTVTCVAL